MNNEYRTMIYPFDIEAVPLIRHSNLIQNYDIEKIVSPKGWALSGKDASCEDGGQVIGMTVDDDFNKELENCDTVFFNDFNRKMDFNKFIYPKIIKAAERSKNIICTMNIEDQIRDTVLNICKENNKFFKYFTNKCGSVESYEIEELFQINTPVVFVVGMIERTHKFEIQLSLREKLIEMGYKVAQIGTRHYCELMGFHSFPKFMYSKAVTESQKVILFNHYVKSIEIEEEPDIIVIGVPGGTMPFNYKLTNRFGILAYEVSQAITPDAVVLSTLYSEQPLDFFKLLLKSYKYKFGYDIDCFNIANATLSVQNSEMERELQYITMDSDFINEKKKNYSVLDTPIYNILNREDGNSMIKFLVNKLEGYADTESV